MSAPPLSEISSYAPGELPSVEEKSKKIGVENAFAWSKFHFSPFACGAYRYRRRSTRASLKNVTFYAYLPGALMP